MDIDSLDYFSTSVIPFFSCQESLLFIKTHCVYLELLPSLLKFSLLSVAVTFVGVEQKSEVFYSVES